jgi:uncharacterized protein (TIGR03437 family)
VAPFSLQLNTNVFPTSACNSAANPEYCSGWQQFIFSDSGAVYIQYQLLNYGTTCPGGWRTYTSANEIDCFINTSATQLPPIQTAADLGGLRLFGQAHGGTDVVVVFTPSEAAAEGQDSVLNLEQGWNTAEFNVFGDGNDSQAVFNPGSTIAVTTSIYDGTANIPACVSETFTGETNNLTLVPICLPSYLDTQYDGFAPTIQFMESNAIPSAPPLLNTGSSLSVTTSSAVLNGSVNPNGSLTFVWYQYSTSSGALNCASPPDPPPNLIPPILPEVEFNADISGLSPGTSYYFVACALYPGGLEKGSVARFMTPLATSPPSLNNPSASAVTSSTATLSDMVDPNGSDTKAWFQYSTGTLSCSLPTTTPMQDVGQGAAPVTFSASITGLSSNTKYNFVACASNAGGEVAYGDTFTTVSATTPVVPQISAGNVFNAATFQAAGIAPNEFIAIKGTGLGPATGVSSTMTTLLAGSSVYIGGTASFLTYAQNGQINALVPFGVTGASTTIQVEFNGVKGNTVTVPVVSSSPGVFTQDYGPGQVWMANQDGSFNSGSNPASSNTYVAFWATGQGLINIQLRDGVQPSGPPFPNPLIPVTVTIGGIKVPAANVVFAGLVYSGEIQLNVLVPENVPIGAAVPIVVAIGGASSRTDATMAIK